MVTAEQVPAGSNQSGATNPLSEIETLLERVRAGGISESSALSRIAVIAGDATAGETYQKPWG